MQLESFRDDNPSITDSGVLKSLESFQQEGHRREAFDVLFHAFIDVVATRLTGVTLRPEIRI